MQVFSVFRTALQSRSVCTLPVLQRQITNRYWSAGPKTRTCVAFLAAFAVPVTSFSTTRTITQKTQLVPHMIQNQYSTTTIGQTLTKRYDYEPPTWAQGKFGNLPQHGRLHLAHLPTPLYRLTPTTTSKDKKRPSLLQGLYEDFGITIYVKRDDMSGGVETGGNKIRKLEFLLAEALGRNSQAVVTIGGIQSNHCRATASAARMVGLDPHLILRTEKADAIYQSTVNNVNEEENESIGTTGNVLFDRMMGSIIYTCTPGEYGRLGSSTLVRRVQEHLEDTQYDANRVYAIPVGGSNAVGTWGYLQGVDEVLQQWKALAESSETKVPPSLDHIVFACGSGGTAAGIGLGMGLAHQTAASSPQVHAVGVCDTPEYFYQHVVEMADEMGLDLSQCQYETTNDFVRAHLTLHQGKGLGYAKSTPDELKFLADWALETGMVLDPVYSGKALYHWFQTILQDPKQQEAFRNSHLLFWHTGGALGLYDKAADLSGVFSNIAPAQRLDVYGKGLVDGIDVSQDKDN